MEQSIYKMHELDVRCPTWKVQHHPKIMSKLKAMITKQLNTYIGSDK